MTKFEIAVTTLFIGYFLGQATDLTKYYLLLHRKKVALKEEVQDHLKRMHYLRDRLCTIAQDFSDPKIIGLPVPGKIKSIVFDKYYPEILPHLNESERLKYSLHFGTVNTFNNGIEQFSESGPVGKKIVNLFHYCCLITETSRDVLDKKTKGSLTPNTSMLNLVHKSVTDFSVMYKLFEPSESS